MDEPARNVSLRLTGLPVIETLQDLANLSRFSSRLLYRVSRFGGSHYLKYDIAKKSGGTRTIYQPSKFLKAVQLWILRNILDKLHTSEASKGFQVGQNIRTNAIPHVGANVVLHIDIEDFFPNVKAGRVHYVFRSLGYSNHIATLLTAICTVDGGLPQGAPTSPKLANLVCLRLDARLLGYSGRRGIVYTRYADDLTFSSFSLAGFAKCVRVVKRIVESEGFRLNDAKTRIAGPARRKMVTGLVLHRERVGISRDKLRQLRSKLHKIACAATPHSLGSSVAHVNGWIAFISDVDKRRVSAIAKYVSRLKERYPNSKIVEVTTPVTPQSISAPGRQ